jgi:hypothetical protein
VSHVTDRVRFFFFWVVKISHLNRGTTRLALCQALICKDFIVVDSPAPMA